MTEHYLNDTSALVRLSRITPDVLRDLLGMAHKFGTADAAPPQACLTLALKQVKAEYARLQ